MNSNKILNLEEWKISKVLEKHNINYHDFRINDPKLQYLMYELFTKNKFPRTIPKELNLIVAMYYKIKKDYENMVKYLLLDVQRGSLIAMFHLGTYYYEIHDIEKMLKYHKMAAKRGFSSSANSLENIIKK